MAHKNASTSSGQKFIENEICCIKSAISEIPNSKLIACCESMIRFRITLTRVKVMDLCLQFPRNYPNSVILMEAKSRTLPEKFLDSVPLAFEKDKEKYIGKPQCILALRFVLDFLEANSLCYCVQEIINLKNLMSLPDPKQMTATDSSDFFKIRQKQSCIVFRSDVLGYFIEVKLEVPADYPAKQIEIDIRETNFPPQLKRFFLAQSKEIARQCVEPPLLRRKKDGKIIPRPANFEPLPSLEPVGKFLIEHVKKYPVDICGLCQKRCFPENPADQVFEEEAPDCVIRIYCDHIYHYGCMDKYMNTPPFEGKKCQYCKATIYHNNWKDSERAREERWAHKEAKARELEEVEDFLS